MKAKRGHNQLRSRMLGAIVVLFVLVGLTAVSYGQNLLQNGGYETSAAGSWSNAANWYVSDEAGGEIVCNETLAYEGTNFVRLNAFGSSSLYIGQDVACTEGEVYEVRAQMMSPEGNDYFVPTNAYVELAVKFYGAGGKIKEFDSDIFAVNGPSNWTRFTSGPMIAPVGATNIKIYAAYMKGYPTDDTTNGYVYIDDMECYTTAVRTAGAILNPDFELQPVGGSYSNVPCWEGFYGNAFAVTETSPRGGKYSLQFWWTGQGLQQSWPATPGVRYETSAYLMSPSSDPLVSTSAFAVVYLEYLNAAGTVLGQSILSDHFTSNSTRDVWTRYAASGIAPIGTVTGRTTCAVLGDDGNFSGFVFYDDVSQAVISSSGTVAGAVYNPGFEDGPLGNAYYLGNDLPHWGWAGGTNAGFIVDAESQDGYQALQTVFPNNLAYQEFVAVTGQTYVASGYMMTPNSGGITDETAYASLLLEFFNPAGAVQTTSVSVVSTEKLDKDSDKSQWIYFSVTNRAPWDGPVTGRLSCAYLDLDGTTSVASVFFDSLSITGAQVDVDNTQSGALWNPGFEYTPQGTKLSFMDNWEALGFEGSVDGSFVRSGNNALKISYFETLAAQYWDATEGWSYSCSGYAGSPSGDLAFTGSTNVYAMLILQYMCETGGVLASYTSDPFWATNYTANTWSNLQAAGRAPFGTVTGRTLCAVLGADDAFGGAVWFDDLSQSIDSTNTITTAGELTNPGFEDGDLGNAYYLSNGLPHWGWAGGTNAGFIVDSESQDGNQALQIVFPNNLAYQEFVAVSGDTYVAEGYMMTPSSGGLTDETAYASLLLEFFNPAGAVQTTSVSVVSSEQLTSSSDKDTWLYFAVTNRAPWDGPVTGRLSCAFLDLDGSAVVASVFFDSLSVTSSHVDVNNSQSGALWNPGFEYTALGTKLSFIDNWEALGFEGSVDNTFKRTGDHALKISYFETLGAQYWDAHEGWRYRCSGYAGSPSGDAAFAGSTNVYAMLILQYMNDTGGVISAYTSDPFWATNYTANTWSNLVAEGRAPYGTVTGRTLCAVLGADDAFGGAVWFDDLSQEIVSTNTTTTAGELTNPGFDDGDLGNAYYLSNGLPHWGWAGGTNAGFIVDSESQAGGQSIQIVFPNNLAYQEFVAVSGDTYVAEGYMMTPSSGGLTDETAYASLLLEFFNPAGAVQTTSVSVVSSEQLTSSSAKDTWLYFAVTNRAPWDGPVTGRVSCAFLDLDGDPVVASVFFDSLSVTSSHVDVDNTQSGVLWNPGFEYTAAGTKLGYIDNWEALGFDGSVETGLTRTGDKALKITYPETLLAQYWPVTGGYKYQTEAWVSTPTGDDKFTTSTNCHAVLLLQYLDESGTNILITYESQYYTGDATADAWSNLIARGVAPQNAVTARTVCAVLGYDEAFGGTVWFDDCTQSLLSTSPSQSGLLINPSFDDGLTGNAYTLTGTEDLPGWKWFGGDDAGYVGNDYHFDGDQAFVLTWPGNYMVQDFTAQSGRTYVAEGYLYTPSATKFDSDGTSYGQIQLNFYVDGDSNPVVEFGRTSAPFTFDMDADTWHYFAVTASAPATLVVTGQVACTIYSDDPEEDWDLGGVIWYDSLTVQAEGGTSAFEQWQIDNFGTTTGSDVEPEGDYDSDGYNNWSEFIAGCDPTDPMAFMSVSAVTQSSGTECVLTWSSVAGRYYAVLEGTNTDFQNFSVLTNNIAATPSENVYTASVPSAVDTYYYRIEVSTNVFE